MLAHPYTYTRAYYIPLSYFPTIMRVCSLFIFMYLRAAEKKYNDCYTIIKAGSKS